MKVYIVENPVTFIGRAKGFYKYRKHYRAVVEVAIPYQPTKQRFSRRRCNTAVGAMQYGQRLAIRASRIFLLPLPTE
jgi:hypothetical protein